MDVFIFEKQNILKQRM